jgi:signal transduction histidine kinase
MNLIKTFSNTLFLILALTGIVIFAAVNIFHDTSARITQGEEAQLAIQMLDEMRRPILGIRNAEYQDLSLSAEKKHTAFKAAVISAEKLLKQYTELAAYNSELLGKVEQLAELLGKWIPLEHKLWTAHLLLAKENVSKDEPVEIQKLHHLTTALFFQALDVLALGEKPVHHDIDDGRAASALLKKSGAILVIYLFILIIIFQRVRQNELNTHKQLLENQVQERTAELEAVNNELEAFAYSVSHDLRAPLRAIDGFSLALLEDCSEQLDDTGKDYLHRVRSASQRMGQLIDDMLLLSQISRDSLNFQIIDLSAMAEEISTELKQANPQRKIQVNIAKDLEITGDKQLIHIALTNLLSNAVKYTANNSDTLIEFSQKQSNASSTFYIKDNGVGFDMQYATKLFAAFQRLHGSEFKGSGIGLATVKRIISRHNGKIWAEAEEGKGACFYFSL